MELPDDLKDPALLSTMVYESEAYQVHMRFERLSLFFYIFRKNYDDLVRLLRGVQHPKALQQVWSQDKREEMTVVLMEITRLLQNFVASVPALVQHTRKSIRNWYRNDPFFELYQQKVNELFGDDIIVHFIEDLRNYTLHYILPVTIATMKISQDPQTDRISMGQAIVFDRDELLVGFDWDKGLAFLNATEDEIVIEAIANHYYEKAREFFEWMQQTLRSKHSEELEWLEAISKGVSEALDES